MSIVKKILSVTMAVMLVMSVVAVGASAVETAGGDVTLSDEAKVETQTAGTATGTEYMTVTVSTDENYKPDDTVTVSVSIANNYNCTAFRFPIMFDSSIYEMPAVLGMKATGDCASKGTFGYNQDGSSFIPSSYDASKFGCILVQWTAGVVSGTTSSEVGALNNEDGQVVFTFNLTVKSDATVGSAGTIFVPAEYDGFYYQAIEDVTDATSFYYLSADTLTKTFVAANPTIIGEAIVLSAKEGTTTVVDDTNKYIYSLGSPMVNVQAFDNYLSLAGTNATLQYEATSYGYGTGTKVKIMLGENVVTSYDVVIFGDANGDSYVDAFDTVEVLNTVLSIKSFNTLQNFAMDILGDGTQGDGVVDGFDLIKSLNIALSIATLSQSNPYQ